MKKGVNKFIHKITEHIHLLPVKLLRNSYSHKQVTNRDVLLQTSLWQFVMLLTLIFQIRFWLEQVKLDLMCCQVWKRSAFIKVSQRSWVTVIPFPAPSASLQDFDQPENNSAWSSFSGVGFSREKLQTSWIYEVRKANLEVPNIKT